MEARPSAVEVARRDVVSAALAERLAPVLTSLVDGLEEDVRREVPASVTWTRGQSERVREALRQTCRGLLHYLRIGDLEATQCEQLRAVVSRPPPGVPDDAMGELVRTIRSAALERMTALLGDVTDGSRRILARELETYLSLITAPSLHVDETGDVDPWLARIATSGRDIQPARRPADA